MHHVKIPVGDLDVALDWYQRVLGATRIEALDHVDSTGTRYAAILQLPGLPFALELRWAPAAARAMRECDVIVFALDEPALFDDWITHLDALGVRHSPILGGGGGSVIVIADPDGKYLRLMAAPGGGLESLSVPANLDPEGPWLDAAPMRHPRPNSEPTSQRTAK
ncbi:hypothetical protein A5784_18355 [Mycobacterium sp. 852013-50091_SCH5140682]|nr:hypothetical protein A5784_18355 [Mycobacterium sp. 852013-50091_SCH5140682]